MSDACGLMRLVLENLHLGVIVIDDEDRIVFANHAAEEIRGIEASSVVGNSVLGCHPVASHNRVQRALAFLRTDRGKPFTRMVEDKVGERHWENTYTPLRLPDGTYMGSVVVSTDMTERRRFDEAMALNAERLERQVAEMSRAFHDLFIASMSSLVAALEAKDRYTAGHSLRVVEIAGKVAEHRWGLSPQSREIRMAGQVHDVGKVGIREAVLLKPGRLSVEEMGHIREHPAIGEKILAPVDPGGTIAAIVRCHHEWFDGSGYPDGIAGDSIPVGSRILAIADAYDSMTTERPYRGPMSPDAAAAEIERSIGKQFDPSWGRLFLELFESGSVG